MVNEIVRIKLRDMAQIFSTGDIELAEDTEIVIRHYNNRHNSGLEILCRHPACESDKVIFLEMHGTDVSVLLSSQRDLDTEVIAELKDDHTRVSGNRIGHPVFEFRHDEVDIVEGWHVHITDMIDSARKILH